MPDNSSRKMAPLDKIRIVLNALSQGRSVKIGSSEYRQHPDAANFFVCMEVRSFRSGEDYTDPKAGKPKYIGGDDISLNSFMNEVIVMPDSEVMVLAAENVLNRENRQKFDNQTVWDLEEEGPSPR